ncbi:hypothetical protein [Streptomyces sp. NPDC014685]|uniref:hypothetical protein n=1 Tax=Streptomyces sp. NPDC014685 TaxID=3364881 RepID=UPI003701DC00
MTNAHDSQARDYGLDGFGTEVRTLVRDSHPDSAHAPYRLFLEETAKDFCSYTVREGVFASAEAADAWAMDRSTPLPQSHAPESTVAHRAQAARTRSPRAGAADLAVPPAPVAAPRPMSPCVPRSGRGTR